MSARKPYNTLAGYVCSRRCRASCGGYIVVYDRLRGFEIDVPHRWVVMHEPTSLHVSVPSLRQAREDMKLAAAGSLPEILPIPQLIREGRAE